MGIVVVSYLAIGALTALVLYLAVQYGIDHHGEDPDTDAGMAALGRSVALLPGGMATALLVVAIAWPGLLYVTLRGRGR